jgi:hypothetical protein
MRVCSWAIPAVAVTPDFSSILLSIIFADNSLPVRQLSNMEQTYLALADRV